jgi:hypothetical protein
MARRRRAHSDTPLSQKQQELARREDDLLRQMEELQRAIQDAPRVAAERARRQREELLARASEGRNRLDVSIALQDKRYAEDLWQKRPSRSMRRQRNEGRLLFLVLVLALALAIIWIATHLRF